MLDIFFTENPPNYLFTTEFSFCSPNYIFFISCIYGIIVFHRIWSWNSNVIAFLALICFGLFNGQLGIRVNVVPLDSYPVCFLDLSALYQNLRCSHVSNGGRGSSTAFHIFKCQLLLKVAFISFFPFIIPIDSVIKTWHLRYPKMIPPA